MNKTAMLKTLKCLLSILLSLVLISTLDTVIIKASFSETNQSNWKDKIDKELWAVMEAKSDSEIIPVYLWLDETEVNNSVKASLRKQGFDPDIYESDKRFNQEVLPSIANDLLRAEALTTSATTAVKADSAKLENALCARKKEYSALRRNTICTEYTNFNNTFVNNFVNTPTRNIIYFSNCTSTLIIEATKAEIEEYAKNKSVEGISFYVNEETQIEDDVCLIQIAADSAVGTKSSRYNSNTGYKGRNVKIGIVEPAYTYDPLAPQLAPLISSGRLTYINPNNIAPHEVEATETTYRNHATMVTSILVGQAYTTNGVTYEGVAPMAEAVYAPIRTPSDLYNAISKLVNEEECSIINYSGGFVNGAQYTTIDKQVDKLIKNLDVILVNSAGNIKTDTSGNMEVNTDCISSPGKAYNVITVGNAETKYDIGDDILPLSSPYKMLYDSSYVEGSYLANKPDISAPGHWIPYMVNTTTISFNSGTSCATPIITGIIAQMLEANPALKSFGAHKVKSMLLASAEYSKLNGDRNNSAYDYCIDDYLVGSYFKEISGAGLVNAVNAVNIARGINSTTTEEMATEANDTYSGSLGVLYGGEKIRMVLTFFKSNTDKNYPFGTLDDLDLYLIKSSTDEMQTRSISSYNNVEIVEFVVPNNGSGEYEYQVLCDSINSTYIPASLTWMKWRPGDVNFDGTTDNLDSVLILQYDSGTRELTPEQLFSADVNKDGVVDNIDSNLIMQYDSGANVVLQ